MIKTFSRFAFLALFVLTPAGVVTAQEGSPEEYVTYSHPDDMPEPVRAKWRELLDAAHTGDLEYLSSIIEAQEYPPNLTFGEMPNGPIEYLREASPDGEGPAILAKMINLLEAPYAVMGPGTEDPVYIWPYLAAVPDLSEMTLDQKVDAYTIGGDDAVKSIADAGGWYSYRILIDKNGNWTAFVRGD